MSYTPRVDDYVKFRNVEGWVYFVCSDYITIEISVKDKSEESFKDSSLHKKVHCLIVCYVHDWEELKYVKHRRGVIEDSMLEYKSQEHRYSDPQ